MQPRHHEQDTVDVWDTKAAVGSSRNMIVHYTVIFFFIVLGLKFHQRSRVKMGEVKQFQELGS